MKKFGFDSMSEEGNEKNIAEGDKEVGSEENFKQNEEDYNQGNARMNDDVLHGHGLRGINSNKLGKCRFEWRRVKCDIVDDARVFLA